jgi:hypothetical protein
MSGRASWIGTRVARQPATRAFPRATRIAKASLLFGSVDRWLSFVPQAWEHSVVKAWIDRTIGPLDTPQRVRLIGWAVISAAMTNAVLGTARLSSNWYAMILWTFAVTLGLVLVSASGPLAAAWRHRRS